LKIPTAKRPGGVAQGLGPEFKTPEPQKKKKKKRYIPDSEKRFDKHISDKGSICKKKKK
jgi:hypothetical protein